MDSETAGGAVVEWQVLTRLWHSQRIEGAPVVLQIGRQSPASEAEPNFHGVAHAVEPSVLEDVCQKFLECEAHRTPCLVRHDAFLGFVFEDGHQSNQILESVRHFALDELRALVTRTRIHCADYRSLIIGKTDSLTAGMSGQDEVRGLRAQVARLQRVARASQALHASLDLREVLRLILDAAAEGVAAERGTVFLFTEDRRELWSEVIAGEEHVEIRLPVGQGLAGHVAATGEVVCLSDAYLDPRFDREWDRRSGFRTRQVLCAPIRNRDGEIVGCFQLLNHRSGEFGPEDERFLEDLSIHAALAVENARLHENSLERERQAREISLALEVQRQVLPERRTLSRARFEAAGINELCEDASGDYYDLMDALPGGRIGVAIGDACGHGLPAALLMAETRALLRAFLSTVPRIDESMRRLNDLLAPDISDGRFISLFAATLDPETGALEWCNAGHCPALLFRADGSVLELAPTGVVLGVETGLEYARGVEMNLAQGDLLLLYSDGATEASSPDGEQFGLVRLREFVLDAAGLPPAALIDQLRERLRAWSGGATWDDDLTLVALGGSRSAPPDSAYARFPALISLNDADRRAAEQQFLAAATADLVVAGATTTAAAEVAAELWNRMSGVERRYHSPMHLLGIFAIAAEMDAPLSTADRLALWFHDAVLDVTAPAGTSEEASALWLESIGERLRLAPAPLRRAAASVRWTARHLDRTAPEEHGLVMDLDLANLAATPEVFAHQSAAVEEELQHLPLSQRRRVSLGFYEALMARPAVFRTAWFAPHEAAARMNLGRAIDVLRAELSD